MQEVAGGSAKSDMYHYRMITALSIRGYLPLSHNALLSTPFALYIVVWIKRYISTQHTYETICFVEYTEALGRSHLALNGILFYESPQEVGIRLLPQFCVDVSESAGRYENSPSWQFADELTFLES